MGTSALSAQLPNAGELERVQRAEQDDEDEDD